MKKLLLRCTCTSCDVKYIREIEEERYQTVKEGYEVIQNRFQMICDPCDVMIRKSLEKMAPDTV